MSRSFSRTTHHLAGVVLVASMLLASASTAWAASAAPARPVEEGWPQTHFLENDPKPGEPGYSEAAPSPAPPQGMTDARLRVVDPDGYQAIVSERTALEKTLRSKARSTLKSSGITPGSTMSAATLRRADALLAQAAVSPYGFLKFRLVPSNSTYARNGYLGTLYFTYGIYSPVTDSYKWYTASWPARSGNNRPMDQRVVGVGPIPEYAWVFGFANRVWYGYQADARESFAPGKWRLDPWTGGPYGRGYLEVHGGINEHQFAATSGCIRLHPGNISALKSYYDTKMANKKDRSTAKLTVDY